MTLEGKNRVQIHTKNNVPSSYAQSRIVKRLAAQSSYRKTLNGTNVEVSVGEINVDEG